ncbi:spore coat U domain-containing protein [Variovorax sp. OV329]|uniref:Csu type fimbrial protein n=1 Tax=Variovorax sp. OV329 TaxID=1882825 RepID=UPI0008F3D5D5|nr:spore coat U domain-containing protein [Variovorax sp. OV329]SFN28477.1 Spore coat protein U (SCPU) domain-containing protein [Variovorax sp. OV329]
MMTTDMRRWWRLLFGLVLCAATWALPAREASAAPSCTANMTALNFGDVDLVSGGTLSATSTLTYTCSNDQSGGTRYMRLCFNIGDGSASIASGGGHWNPRILRDSASTPNEMNVQFYQGATGIIWGSTTQPIPDAYDVVVTMPTRVSSSTPSVTTGSFDMRGLIGSGQAALPNGTYTSGFTGNHTAFRYTASSTSSSGIGDCSSATTDGGTFGFAVSANVVKSCLVTADPLDFGSVDGIPSATGINAQTNVYVTCSRPTAYRVLLIPSNNSTTGSSAMKGTIAGNTDTVPYQLYRDAARSQQWGNQTANSLTGTGNGLAQPIPVYGRVPNIPNVRPDNYKDTVTVSVTY